MNIFLYKKHFFIIHIFISVTLSFSYAIISTVYANDTSSESTTNEKETNDKKQVINAVLIELKKNKGEIQEKTITPLAKEKKQEKDKQKQLKQIKKVDIHKKHIIPTKKNINELGRWIISDEIILTGIKEKTFLRIGKGWYKINNKEWDNKKIEIKNNDSLKVRHKSSLFHKGETTSYIYINNSKKITFTSITK